MTDREAIRRLAVIVANLATLRNERDSIYDLIREMDESEPAAPTVTREQAEEVGFLFAAAIADQGGVDLMKAYKSDPPSFFRAVADALEGE